MKSASLTLLMATLTLMAGITACYEIEPFAPDPDSIYSKGLRVKPRTERELAANANLYLSPGTLVVMDLEHTDSPAGDLDFDTDTNGVDIIRYEVKDTTVLVFNPDINPYYSLRFFDEAMDSMYFSLHNGGEKANVKLVPGKYVLKLVSLIPFGADTAGRQIVFVQPDLDFTTKSGSTIKYFYMTSRAMECVKCDLSELDLSGFYLAGAMLESSLMTECILDSADLQDIRASKADFSKASLIKADLRGSNLSLGIMKNADLRNADFQFAILNGLDLSGAKAYGTNFCSTTRNGWIIEGVMSDTTTLCFP